MAATVISDSSMELAKELIKHFEGLKLIPYYCPAGVRTIGYGHAMRLGDELPEQISQAIAEELLEKDIIKAKTTLYRHCKVPLTSNQEAALCSFIFNCGGGAFQSSTLRQKLSRCEYALAANEFPRWVYSRGIKLGGLVKRRLAEQQMFLAVI